MLHHIHRVSQIKILLAALTAAAILFLSGCGPTEEAPKPKAAIGKPAPKFFLTDLKGNDWDLSQLRGKVVFINFWGTFCPPCIEELPSMQKLFTSIDPAKFQMLTILYRDTPELGQSMVSKSGYTFPVLIDPGAVTAGQYGITGVPETFIIDPQGVLREWFIGPYNWNSPSAIALINKYLPK